jgi:hypothetical protein
LADNDDIKDNEWDKIRPYTVSARGEKHGCYDFGSWSIMLRELRERGISPEVDELIFSNDSCFCLGGFDTVFNTMDRFEGDFWALYAMDEMNHDTVAPVSKWIADGKYSHMFCYASNFLVFRRALYNDTGFIRFMDGVVREKNRLEVCLKYEVGLTRLLIYNGFRCATFIENLYINVFIYRETAFHLLQEGLPLLKIRIFTENPLSIPDPFHFLTYINDVAGNERLSNYIEELKKSNRRLYKPRFAHSHGIKQFFWLFLIPYHRDSLKLALSPIRNKRSGRLINRFLAYHVFPQWLTDQIRSYLKTKTAKNRELRLGGNRGEKRGKYLYHQKNLLQHHHKTERMTVFFTVARDAIAGGMLSIDRFVQKSLTLKTVHNSEIVLSGIPTGNKALPHSLFKDSLPMTDFELLVRETDPDHVTLMVPECSIPLFVAEMLPKTRSWLQTRRHLHINVMNQNNDLLPEPSLYFKLFELTPHVTMTTAHVRYTTQQLADTYQSPVRLLTPFLPDFVRSGFETKKKVILYSPDSDITEDFAYSKEDILWTMKEKLPDYTFREIRDIHFEQYKILISEAMFTITFGEGFDGFFLEPFLSDSIAFAVFNKTFFPEDFADAPTVYSSWEEFMIRLPDDIKRLEREGDFYKAVQNKTESLIKRFISDELSLQNLKDFYLGRFEYLPEKGEP